MNNPPTTTMPAVSAETGTTAAPPVPAAHFWRQKVPAHIGRARTSTLVLGALFVLFATVYLLVRPEVEYTTIETTSGETYRVPVSELAPATEPSAPAPTTEPTDATPTDVPTTTPEEDDGGTTAPRSTTSAGTDEEAEETTRSRAPATTEAPTTTAEPTDSDEEPSAPTS